MRWLEYHGTDPEVEPETIFASVIDPRHMPKDGYVLAVNETDRPWDIYVRTAPGAPHSEPITTVEPNSSRRVWGRVG